MPASNWKTFDDRTFDFCQGITLHHLPGHTDGKSNHHPLQNVYLTCCLRVGRYADQYAG